MNEVMMTVLSVSFSGALLILLLCLLRPLYKDRLGKGWQYYIWLVVIARLLLPYSPETNLAGTLFEKMEGAGRTAVLLYQGEEVWNAAVDGGQGLMAAVPESDTGTAPLGKDGGAKETAETVADDPILHILDLVRQYLWCVWLAVGLILLIRKITIYQSFAKYIRAGCAKVEDFDVLERFGRLAGESGIRGSVELCTNPLVSSPLLIGFFRPCIILPTAEVSETDFRYTILHELTHYKRLDMFYKWLAQFTICLHWFNPLVYRMGREINRTCELACDEAVFGRLDPKERRSYGDTLLHAVGAGGSYKDSLACVTLGESKELLKERLDAIMGYRKKTKMILCVSMLLAAGFLCGAAYAGAYAGNRVSNEGSGGKESGRHGSVTSAPGNLETKTAGAAHFTQKDTPDLNITIGPFAAVELVPTTDAEVTVGYPDTLYQAQVDNQDGNWNVSISYVGSYSKYPSAVLYIPDIEYGNVYIQSREATVTCNGVFQKGGSMEADLEDSSVFYTIPDGFQGTLNAAASDTYLELRSESGYRNCDVTILNCTTFGNIADGFTKKAGSLTNAGGTGAGVVRIDMDNSGYATLE